MKLFNCHLNFSIKCLFVFIKILYVLHKCYVTWIVLKFLSFICSFESNICTNTDSRNTIKVVKAIKWTVMIFFKCYHDGKFIDRMINSVIWSSEHELGAQIPIRTPSYTSVPDISPKGCNGGIIIIPLSRIFSSSLNL